MTTVAIYGAGQLGNGVAELLRGRPALIVRGPYNRDSRQEALTSGADVVIIATTTRLRDVANDIEMAVNAGSNVLVSAEEAANPFVVDFDLATRLDSLGRSKGVSISGAGLNPGLIFDALLLTLLGATQRDCRIHVRRVVDISGFGETVLRRIGIGKTVDEFASAVAADEILGHAGFPQSISVVADAIGVRIDRIDKTLLPVITDHEIDVPGRMVVLKGQSAGVNQTYTAIVDEQPWYIAHFFGHVSLSSIKRETGDDIDLLAKQRQLQSLKIRPGFAAQVGSKNMVANSIDRIIRAKPGWVTVANMVPAFPEP